MRGSVVESALERRLVLNAIALQNAVLCAECDVVSDSPHEICLVCGSRSLFNIARGQNGFLISPLSGECKIASVFTEAQKKNAVMGQWTQAPITSTRSSLNLCWLNMNPVGSLVGNSVSACRRSSLVAGLHWCLTPTCDDSTVQSEEVLTMAMLRTFVGIADGLSHNVAKPASDFHENCCRLLRDAA